MGETADKRIAVRESTRQKLSEMAGKGTSYDEQINEMIEFYDTHSTVVNNNIMGGTELEHKMYFSCTKMEKLMISMMTEKSGMDEEELVRHMVLTVLLMFDESTKAKEILTTEHIKPSQTFGEVTVDMDTFLHNKLSDTSVPLPDEQGVPPKKEKD